MTHHHPEFEEPLEPEQVAEAEVADVRRKLPRALTPFHTPAYRKLAVALVLTVFAWGIWVVALVWEVIRLDGSTGDLSLVSAANAIGMVIPVLFAGAVADRIPQKLILIAVATVQASCMVIAAILSLTDLASIPFLVGLALVYGCATSFYYPAYSAWLPALVPEQDLLAVNGFEGMVRPTIGQALGPAFAGFLVGAASSGWGMLVAAAAAFGALAALFPVPLTPVRRDLAAQVSSHPVRSALVDIREGFGYMVRTPWLLATLLFASLMTLFIMGPIEVLVPFHIKDHLGGDAGDHALVLAAFGIGGAVASMAIASFPMPRRYLTVMNLSWGLGCLPLAFIGIADSVWIIVPLALVLGAMFSGPMVIWGTLLQRRVPSHMLGRVSSLDFFVSISLMPVSMALAGPVSELIGMQETFLLAGTLPMVIAVIAIVWARLPADEVAHPLD
ncbi:MFS transporter [Nocardioides sp. AE5]|uniref:MFS transporter n=1 Tax=Nocardioides sp. AE5 TaxID=2962573 RepID=UPI00288250CA|nr:MFS transporter [Nocardioides sp. AE5]MDT0203037.1 MFS transporter [Nocardioides sp. AE5]